MGIPHKQRPFNLRFTPFNPNTGEYARLGPADIRVFVVSEIYHDHIVSEDGVMVAKPYHLRRSPWDKDSGSFFPNEEWDGIFDDSYKIEFEDDLIGWRRKIILDGESEMDHPVYEEIKPNYIEGEVIVARKVQTGIVDYNANDGNGGLESVTYVDLNLAGREWQGITSSLFTGTITAINNDYLTISYQPDGLDEAEDVLIAKPFMLRKTPFDGQTVNSITYAYDEDDENKRIATEDGEDREEYLRPAYYVGEEITIARIPQEITVENDSGAEIELRYVDANTSGKSWVESLSAKESASPYTIPAGTGASAETTEWDAFDLPSETFWDTYDGVQVGAWFRLYWSGTSGDPVYQFRRSAKYDENGLLIYVGPEVRSTAFETGLCGE